MLLKLKQKYLSDHFVLKCQHKMTSIRFFIVATVCLYAVSVCSTRATEPSNPEITTEKETSPCPNDGWKWFFYRGACYTVGWRRETWEDAESICQGGKQRFFEFYSKSSVVGAQAHLVSIHDLDTNGFIDADDGASRLFSNVGDVWLGLNKKVASVDRFAWSDGSAVSFTSWTDLKNRTINHCGYMIRSGQFRGQWNYTSCTTKLNFICKFTPKNIGENNRGKFIKLYIITIGNKNNLCVILWISYPTITKNTPMHAAKSLIPFERYISIFDVTPDHIRRPPSEDLFLRKPICGSQKNNGLYFFILLFRSLQTTTLHLSKTYRYLAPTEVKLCHTMKLLTLVAQLVFVMTLD